MKIRTLYFFLVLLSSACGGDPEKITERFFQNKEYFEQLSSMIKEDKKVRVVGMDNIGNFWEFKGVNKG